MWMEFDVNIYFIKQNYKKYNNYYLQHLIVHAKYNNDCT